MLFVAAAVLALGARSDALTYQITPVNLAASGHRDHGRHARRTRARERRRLEHPRLGAADVHADAGQQPAQRHGLPVVQAGSSAAKSTRKMPWWFRPKSERKSCTPAAKIVPEPALGLLLALGVGWALRRGR
jgi:hypothetical protein